MAGVSVDRVNLSRPATTMRAIEGCSVLLLDRLVGPDVVASVLVDLDLGRVALLDVSRSDVDVDMRALFGSMTESRWRTVSTFEALHECRVLGFSPAFIA